MRRRFSGLVVLAILVFGLVVGFGSGGVAAEPPGALTVSGPATAAVGDVIDLTVVVPPSATATETVIDFDDDALDFGGLYAADTGPATLRVVANQDDRVAIAAYRCADPSCEGGLATGIGPLTVRFAVNQAGEHHVRFGATVSVLADGSTVAADQAVVTVVVGSPDEADPTSGRAGVTPSDDRRLSTRAAADLTADGRITGADVTEVDLAWAEVRRAGDPCALSNDRLTATDIDGSGCIDVADLAAVARLAALDQALADERGGRVADGPDNQALVDAAADPPTPMVVNSTSDEWDANLNNGICNTPSGVCSLRAAILQANANPGPDIIHFAIPGSGPHRITLGDRLPTINDTTGPLTIDGYTQPGASTNTSDRLSNADIRIEVYGEGFSGDDVSLVIASADNTIRGLSIYRAFWNVQLTGSGATGNRVVGNFIGTNASGTYELSSSPARDQAGVEIGNQASFNHIGTPALEDRNVISGNPYSGVRINHAGTRGNLVQNNLVGLRPDGGDSLYTRVAGIDVQWGAEETWVGGYQEHAGNVVTGNDNYGIDLSHSSKNNRVVGNYLGTDATGTRVLSHTPNLIGLAIKDDTVGNLIEHNVMGGNDWDGIWHRHNFTGVNTFRYNRIGIGVDGSDIGNDRYGVHLTGHDDTYEGNLVANNGSDGFYISSYNGGNGFSPPQYTERNEITDNSFFDNGGIPIDISGAHNNIARPRVTSISTGAASGTACSGCRVELYIGSDTGRQFIGSTTAGGGSWSFSSPAIANTSLTVVAIASNGDTSEFSSAVGVGSSVNNVAPTITPIPDQSGQRFGLVTIPVSASDGDGNHLSYSALGLPAGVAIDSRTGEISGRPGSVGEHVVHVRVDDGGRATQTAFRWTVVQPNRAPTVDAPSNRQVLDDFESDSGWTVNPAGTDTATTGMWEIGDLQASPSSGGSTFQLGTTPSGVGALATGRLGGSSVGTYDIDGGPTTVRSPAIALPGDAETIGFQYYFAHLSNASADDYFSATVVAADGSRTEVLINRGGSSVRAAAWGPAAVDVSPWAGQTIRIEFGAADAAGGSLVEAAVDDLTMTARSVAGTVGEEVSLTIDGDDPDGDPLTWSATGLPGGLSIDSTGRISGTLNQAGSFSVEVTATDPSGASDSTTFAWTVADDPNAFTCSVDGSTLSWTDDGATTYYIRRTAGGVDTYVGSTTNLSFPLTDPTGTFTVRHWTTGSPTDAVCDGQAGQAFTCSVDGSTLSWTDDGATTYYIRRTAGGVDSYVGSTTNLSFPLTDPTGTFTVRHWTSGAPTDATCEGQAGPTFTCSVDASTLSWTDDGATTYYIRQLLGGVDTYLGSTTNLSFPLTDPAGTYTVRHWTTGSATDATCSP